MTEHDDPWQKKKMAIESPQGSEALLDYRRKQRSKLTPAASGSTLKSGIIQPSIAVEAHSVSCSALGITLDPASPPVCDPASPPVCEHAECHRAERAPSLRPCGRRSTSLRGMCYRRCCQTRMAAPCATHSSNVHTHGRHRSSATHTDSLRGTMRAACCAAVCCAAIPPPDLGAAECPGRGCGNSLRHAPATGRGYTGVFGAWDVARRVAICAGVDAEGIGAAEGGAGAVDIDKDRWKGAALLSGGSGSCSTQCRRSCASQAGP